MTESIFTTVVKTNHHRETDKQYTRQTGRKTERQPEAQRNGGDSDSGRIKEDEQMRWGDGRERVGMAPRSKLALYERNGRPIRRAASRPAGCDSIDDVAVGRQTGSYIDTAVERPLCSQYIIVALRQRRTRDAPRVICNANPRNDDDDDDDDTTRKCRTPV